MSVPLPHRTIALIYDFDLTLSPEYMQEPLFRHFKYDGSKFWDRKKELVEQIKSQGRDVQDEIMYLNLIIEYAKNGMPFEGLTQDLLIDSGKNLKLYPGVESFFTNVNEEIAKDPRCKDAQINIEHYVTSSGMADILRGSSIYQYLEKVDSCEFIYDGKGVPVGVCNVVTFTEKTQTLFKVNKGIYQNKSLSVNSSIPDKDRRVPMSNMIYYGDGPSDVPCMSIIKSGKGYAFGVYNPESDKALKNAFDLLMGGRVIFCTRADYSKGSDLYNFTIESIKRIAVKRIEEYESYLKSNTVGAPTH